LAAKIIVGASQTPAPPPVPLEPPVPPAPPVPPGIGQPVFEQQLQVRVVGPEHAVVKRLLVNRVGTPLQQQRGQLGRERMAGLPSWPLLPFSENAGQHGERRRHPTPQVAGVGICTRLKQNRCGSEDSALRVADVDT